jgi:O-acetyl-ADP-ribose deacetylase (regulator of RNase III)
MKIIYKTGDLLRGDHAVVVHGCNARGTFGAGVAGHFRREMPFVYEAYRKAFEAASDGLLALGEVIWAFDLGGKRPRIVGNMITQQDFGRDAAKQYVNYDAITVALQKVNAFVRRVRSGHLNIAELPELHEVGMPLVGCGLGNGDWPTIASIIENEAVDFTPVVYLLDGKVP